MSGCFGNSSIDRWIERSLHGHLETHDVYGERTLTFKLWKGKKLISTWNEDISNEDSCYHTMKKELIDIHTKSVRNWLNDVNETSKLIGYARRSYYVCNQETFTNILLDENKEDQEKVLERWAMLPKLSRCEYPTGFNIARMGKYTITCFDKAD